MQQYYTISFKKKLEEVTCQIIYEFYSSEPIKSANPVFTMKVYNHNTQQISKVFLNAGVELNPKLMTALTIKLKSIIEYNGYLGCVASENGMMDELKVASDSNFRLIYDSNLKNY